MRAEAEKKRARKTYRGFEIQKLDGESRFFFGVFLNRELIRSFDSLVDAVKWTSGSDNPDPQSCACPKCLRDIRRGLLARANQEAEDRSARTKALKRGR